ncbi:MAG: hypothetical protein AB8G11_19345 [Saprospiraceae bacterium]
MRYKVLLLLGFIFIISCNQVEKKSEKTTKEEIKTPEINFVKTVPITGVVSLAFAKTDTIFNLYREPYIVVGERQYPIKGYHSINSSSDKIIALSPNGRYFIMDSISIGEIEDENEELQLHDNYFCVVVDLLHKRVIHQMQSHCDGEWNAQGQWVKDGQIILSFD